MNKPLTTRHHYAEMDGPAAWQIHPKDTALVAPRVKYPMVAFDREVAKRTMLRLDAAVVAHLAEPNKTLFD